MESKKNYYFSGTLGDAFIAFCKLSYLKQNIEVTRLSRIPNIDIKIAELSQFFPNIKYNENYIHFDEITEMRDFAFKNENNYINIFWDGKGRLNEPDDPKELYFEPFPNLKISKAIKEEKNKTIGIQLHSGSRIENQRALSIDWILELIEKNRKNGFKGIYYLFGTGDGYSEYELKKLENLSKTINYIGKQSLKNWLETVSSLDYYITPEGLASFFALSQRIPTLVIYEDKTAIMRMHYQWRLLSTCLRPFNKDNLLRYIPLPIPQTNSIINSIINPSIS